MTATPTIQVAHFRQVLLWPLRLMPQGHGGDDSHVRPWEVLKATGGTCPWREVDDVYTGACSQGSATSTPWHRSGAAQKSILGSHSATTRDPP